MSTFSRRWLAFATGVVMAVVGVVAVLALFTQTDRGRERILAFTLETLGGQLNPEAELVIGRLEGGLFTGARMYDIVLRDPEGEEMVAADSAYIEYRVATFLSGDVVIEDLVLFSPEILLYRFPGDSLWNYQAVLQDTSQVEPTGVGRATILQGMRLVDADVMVRLPWEPADDLSAAEREDEIEAALSDTSRLAVETVPGGYLRTIFMTTPQATIEDLTVAPDERGGTYLRVAQGEATIHLYRDIPIQVEDLRGELSLRAGVVRYTAPRVQLPSSTVATSGVLDMSGEEPLYDVRIDGSSVALRDVRWLYPRFPEEGSASFEMAIETRPDELFMRATGLELQAPGTRLVGDFSLLMGDSLLLFSDVALRADPLDMSTVEAMLPMSIPVRGLEIGTVEMESSSS